MYRLGFFLRWTPETAFRFCLILACLLGVTVASPAAAEVVLVDDDFQDGDRNGWFSLDQEDVGPIDPSLSVISADTLLGSSRELSFTSTSNRLLSFATHFSSFTLSNPGDSIELTFDARNIDGGFFPEGLSFGFFDSGTQQFTSDGDLDRAPNSEEDNGIYAVIDAGNFTSSTNGSEDAFLRVNDDNSSARLFEGTNIAVSDDRDDSNDPLMFTENTNFTYRFALTRNASNGIDILLSNNETGTTPGEDMALAGTLNAPNTFSFDTLYVGANQDGPDVDFRFDNFRVSATAVPEPSALLLLSALGAVTWARRRTRRTLESGQSIG